MQYFGNKCGTAEKRAENKNGVCKDIHNDESAAALLWIGVILSLPFLSICALFCACIMLASCLSVVCGDDSSSNAVAPFGDNDNADTGFLPPLIGKFLGGLSWN